jgi:indolepyruvate ferredoxin oxidoreductase alpha subunit
LPSIARKQYRDLLDKQDAFELDAEEQGFNSYIDAPNKKMGVVACGLAYNYLMENLLDSDTSTNQAIGQMPQAPMRPNPMDVVTKGLLGR